MSSEAMSELFQPTISQIIKHIGRSWAGSSLAARAPAPPCKGESPLPRALAHHSGTPTHGQCLPSLGQGQRITGSPQLSPTHLLPPQMTS